MEKVILGLGSNTGNRSVNIKKAVKEISLTKGVNVIKVSLLYETEPWGLKNQRKFLNCVIICLCKLKPVELLKNLYAIEKKLGRKRRIKWGPREIDIDILFFGSMLINRGNIIIPHPLIELRNFVLIPLAGLMPDFVHPELKIKMINLLKNSPDKSKAELY